MTKPCTNCLHKPVCMAERRPQSQFEHELCYWSPPEFIPATEDAAAAEIGRLLEAVNQLRIARGASERIKMLAAELLDATKVLDRTTAEQQPTEDQEQLQQAKDLAEEWHQRCTKSTKMASYYRAMAKYWIRKARIMGAEARHQRALRESSPHATAVAVQLKGLRIHPDGWLTRVYWSWVAER